MTIYLLFLIGLVFLIKGADFLVEGSSLIAKRFGIPSLVVGLTIVAFGTSMPELVVSLIAATGGQASTAFGNVIGSNIANILLILGAVALIYPPKLKESTTWKEIPFSLLAVIVLFVVSNDKLFDGVNITALGQVDGIILLLFFGIFLYYVSLMAFVKSKDLEKETVELVSVKLSKQIFYVVIGMAGLYFGGKWIVDSATQIATSFGVSEFVIAATVISLGTSLPELITSVKAAMRNESDMAVGNIIGSNIFNIFWILGITSVVAPVEIPATINSDIIFLFAATVLLFAFVFIGKKHRLEKWQGVFFLSLYVVYIISLLMRG